jgi:hypothetical protein
MQQDLHPIDDLYQKTNDLTLNYINNTSTIASDQIPPKKTANSKTNEVIYAIIDHNDKSIGYMDMTGHLLSTHFIF